MGSGSINNRFVLADCDFVTRVEVSTDAADHAIHIVFHTGKGRKYTLGTRDPGETLHDFSPSGCRLAYLYGTGASFVSSLSFAWSCPEA